ncbi:Phosphatidylserine decarboxylase proenzyme 3 [Beauveria bassiana]|nr:Phosphatidylserine decarboxylase proenzyme 3 [Beauveria bassiana]KAH8719826.1 Phosphatidylserine decarboxylase proenzyme 3 [Beauveria bassiana]
MRLHIHRKTERRGVEESSSKSKQQIRGFVESYGINMADFDPSDIDKYTNFEAFFARRLNPGSRPIFRQDDASAAVVVADSRVVVFKSVAATKGLWIKGSDFNVTEVVMDTRLGAAFVDGAIASFRLSPQDYHRYHSPVSGRVKLFRSVPGDYYQVDPVALRSDVNILTQNRRSYVVIETAEFGDVLFVAIGATEVGNVQIHEAWQKKGSEIKKGEELGLFQFGGSSIIVAFQKGRIQFDEDLLKLSRAQIQVSVEMGMSLGQAVKSGA